MPVDAGLASLSDNLLLAAIAAYIAAMFGYTIEYAFGRRREHVASAVSARVLVGAGAPADETLAGETPEQALARLALGGRRPTAENEWPARFGAFAMAATALAVLLQVACIVARGMAAHRVPVGNMYEFVSAVCVVGVVAWLVLALRRPVRHLGAFVIPVVLMLLGIAGSLLYTDAAPLMPALNSIWIKIHVPAAILASGLFMIGFVMAALYLVRQRADERAWSAVGGAATKPRRGPQLPDAQTLERLTFRIHAIAFPIWTVAIILGAIWAESAWSRYWGWDPKETWAFVSWVVYAAYLHARATAGWRGKRAAMIAVVGWATMMFNLFAINLVYSGLHSYSGLN
jgi:cytochrome c-type biogenesis protein CcsB